MPEHILEVDDEKAKSVADHRAAARRALHEAGADDLLDDALLVTNELVTNAILHGGGVRHVGVRATPTGVRIDVADGDRNAPFLAVPSEEAMTGRGLHLVSAIATRWGTDIAPEGKVVWVELDRDRPSDGALEMTWDAATPAKEGAARSSRVVLGAVPTELLVEAKSHVDNLVREFALLAGGARSGTTPSVPAHLADLINVVVNEFAIARDAIKRQAAAAARRGQSHVRLELDLPLEAADAGEAYIRALDEIDAYCRAARLLTLETPPQHRVFRTWYVEELVAQLRAAGGSGPPRKPQTFEARLLAEVDEIARAQRISDRAARLYDVSAALSVAATPEAVAAAVVGQGVAALGASGGGILLAADDHFIVPATVGYAEDVVGRLREESVTEELPGATALRTGEPVWLESREERDDRFPELVGLERDTVSMCAVPLVARARKLGAIRFSFREPRLFDSDERRFVLALAALAAQALDRAQLYEQRIDLSRRLQRSLLPGRLPSLPGMDIAAVYHPSSDGMELGGDFYDVWQLAGGRWAFAIGDASGTGPEAAAITAVVRFTLRALTAMDLTPVVVLERLNRAVLDLDPDPDRGERFCTTVLGVVTPGDRPVVELAGGGHPAPFLRAADGITEAIDVGGSIVGIIPGAPMASARVVLHPGDAIVLYTDGASEARHDGQFFGTAGVQRVVEQAGPSAHSIAQAIEVAVLQYTAATIQDDLAALIVRVED